MQLTKTTLKTKCDFPGCKNIASNTIGAAHDTSKKMNFCEECLNSIYECIAKTIVPKGIESAFKKQKKLR